MEEQGKKAASPLRAIRANCLECCGGSANEVRLCTCPECPLYPFRFGKNPYLKKREYTEEQRERLRQQLARGRRTQQTERGE